MGKRLIFLDANFSENAINELEIVDNAEYALVNGVAIQTNNQLNNNNQRANVLVTRISIDNPNTWSSSSNSPAASTYSMIPIPYGANTVTIKCTNTAYYYGLCVRNSSGIALYDSGWKNGGETSVTLSEYSGDIYISSTLKIGAAGTTNFSNETLASVGWSIEWQ